MENFKPTNEQKPNEPKPDEPKPDGTKPNNTTTRKPEGTGKVEGTYNQYRHIEGGVMHTFETREELIEYRKNLRDQK